MQILNQAIILAGGKGVRLGKITKTIPKPLIKFQNKPFLHYIIENLKINKVNKIIVLAGYKGNQIKKSLKKFKNVKVFIEKKPLGTGGALINTFKLLHEKFLFLNGDSFFNVNLQNKILKFRNKNKSIFFLVKNSNYKLNKKLSSISINSKGRIINKIGKLMYSGISILVKKDLKILKKNKKNKLHSFEDNIAPKLISRNKVEGDVSNEFFLDIGTTKNYEFAKSNFKKKTEKKCIFFDRDNTLIYDKGYTHNKSDLKWKPGAIKAIQLLNESNYLVIVITNQSGVARGYFTERDVESFHYHMNQELKKKNAVINDFYYCPFHINGIGKYKKNSKDRKPGNGMLNKAIKKWNINKKRSFFIGDSLSDYLAAKKSNIKYYQANDNLYYIVKKLLNI
jgi:D,D-heptose 1,7-bisphosphate phosphatase